MIVLSFLISFFFSSLFATNLTLFSINDVYEVLPSNGYGGLSELATILKRERAQADHYITTVNGDFLSPSLISGFFHGSQMIDLFNLMEVDVVVFGNHEFDFGIDVLAQRMRESRFCWLGSNVLTLHKGIPFNKAQSSVIFDVDGFKIGMIGLCTTEANFAVQNSNDVTFTPVILSAQAVVHRLKKEGADVIIALTHLNFEEDLQLAVQVPEIDLVLGGHDHDVITWFNGRTLIHKSGHDAQFLSRIDLRLEKKQVGTKEKVIMYPSWKMIPNYGFEPDSSLEERVSFYANRIDEELSQKIAICETALDSSNVRIQETTMGNLIADALRKRFNADIALLNGGSIRGKKLYLPGTSMTKLDIQEELPFGNIAVLLEATGEQILQALEHALSKIEHKGGGFPQVSGMRVVYNSDNVLYGRVCEAFINGEPLDKKKIYRVATHDYLFKGGDGNTGLSSAKSVVGPGIGPLLSALVIEYLKESGVANNKIEGRILDCHLGINVKQGITTGKRVRFN
jgi:5'-nucleotidase / UDP-sugar diphosphatase